MLDEIFEITTAEGFPAWSVIAGVSTILLYLVVTIVIRKKLLNKKGSSREEAEENARAFVAEPEYFFNSVMEIMVSNTCIFGVLCLYYRFLPLPEALQDYSSLYLLLLIVVAIVINNVIDMMWLNRTWASTNRYPKSHLRMLSSISILLIIIVVSCVFDVTKYVSVIVMMLGLVLGRFIYFDSSVEGIVGEIRTVFRCWKSLAVALVLMAILLVSGIALEVINSDNMVFSLFAAHFIYLLLTELSIRVLKAVQS